MKPVLLILALVLVPSLCEAQPRPSYRARSLSKDEPQAIYSSDPNDAWNRIFHCLFTRTVPVRASNEFRDAGPFTTFYVNSSTDRTSLSVRSLERVESGDGAIDPLYPSFSSTDGRSLVLTEPRFSQLHDALAAALKETIRRPPLARALMQGDAWAAYDLLHDYGTDKTRAEQARCDQLLELLARFIKKLALTPGEIDQLPDNYGAAARIGKVPDLFAPESGWLEVEWLPQRFHDHAADFRRATRVFLKPASAPPDKQAFVDSLPRSHGIPAGLDSAAQVTQLLLIDTNAKVVPTRLTHEVQLRTFVPDKDTKLALHELSRRLLLDGRNAAGFVEIQDKDPAYLAAAFNDYGFATRLGLSRETTDRELVPTEAVLVSQRQRCVTCHGANSTAILTFPGLQQPSSAPPVKLLKPSENTRGRYVAHEKSKRADFKDLRKHL
jgi:hypothetical protein